MSREGTLGAMLKAPLAVVGMVVLAALAGLVDPRLRTSVAASKLVATAGCDDQSEASFPGAFARRQNLVVGPLVFSGLRDMSTASRENITQHGGFKSPALLRPGHTVKVSVDRNARSVARLDYVHARDAQPAFADLPHTIRFTACSAGRAESDVDGQPVTFWSGFFRLTGVPACVPITITIDRRRSLHRRLPVAGGRCT